MEDLLPKVKKLFELSAQKILSLHKTWKSEDGAPVFTRGEKYTSCSWTEWTQGFQFGSALLQFDATGDEHFLQIGKEGTLNHITRHLTHTGVHDHGFNTMSTFGDLYRLMREEKISDNEWEKKYYELGLKVSGAVQASRWTQLSTDEGYIYSFNGPHSLFIDTMRSLRVLCIAHQLGHELFVEQDARVNLLHRSIQHALTTAKYNVYFGEGRDAYDVCGRVAHESIFNVKNGSYRSPNNQQGYSAYSTWMRGLAWCILGYAELLEFIDVCNESEFHPQFEKQKIIIRLTEVIEAASDFYFSHVPTDGIAYWDSDAPGLVHLGDYLNEPSKPFNDYEPIDSSAAVIAAQGFLRYGSYLKKHNRQELCDKYFQSAFTIASSLFNEPYLSTDPNHQGLILHSVYHRPKGWDYIPPDRKIPCGESSMWGDYHARELALMILRMIKNEPYYCFYLK